MIYYKKQVREGTYSEDGFVPQLSKKAKIAVIVVCVLLVAVIAFILFTGELSYVYKDDCFTVEATYYEDITVCYEDIENIVYWEDADLGHRQYGYESFKLSMGVFKSDQFGKFTRYTYNGCDACVVLTVNGKTIILNGKDSASTKALYNEIHARVEGLNEGN